MKPYHSKATPLILRSAADVEQWLETITAMEEAQRHGSGAIKLHGQVVDEAHVWKAKQELAKAARWGLVP